MDKTHFPVITDEDRNLPFYMKTVGIRENQEHIVRPDGYPDFHWLCCTKGSGLLCIAESTYSICEGMGFFFYPGISHEYYSLEEPWETHWITFDGFAVKQFFRSTSIGQWEIFSLADTQRAYLLGILHSIYTASISNLPSRSIECSGLLYRFLLSVAQSLHKEENRPHTDLKHQLHPVIMFIEANFNNQIALEDMAAEINVSPPYLCALFRQAYNMRPFAYLTTYRIQKAKELIINQRNLKVKDIAAQTGYSDTSYFCSVFKEYEGITPLEFKRIYTSA